jgi:hypothetical protein
VSDDDRLADYLARMDNPDHVRTLSDGCACGHSAVYCRCVAYIEGRDARCCGSCQH